MKKHFYFIFILLVFSLVLVGCTPKKDSELVLQQKEIYQLAQNVGFSGTFEEWLDSIKGEQGIPGDNIELSVSDGYIKWKNKTESQWYNLLPLVDLVGTNGTDGKEVTFQVSDGYIKWQYVGETTWTNLVELSTLVGPQGPKGNDGTNGTDGKEVTFQVSDGYIKWQYVGETTWTNLVELSTLVGPQGPKGNDGIEGKSAYEIYKENYPDYIGSEQDWLDDLINGKLGNKEKFTVSFDTKGLMEIESLEVTKGEKVEKPIDPIKVGYTFEGWYVNGDEKWVFGGYNITEDVTLVANFIANEYLVTFDAGLGVVEPSEVYYTYDEEVELPIPVLEDNYFMGWYNGDELVEDGLWKIASDIELTAYSIQEKYNVYYDFGYDDLEEIEQARYGQMYSQIKPSRDGHTFKGWYDENGVLFEDDELWGREADIHLTALWEANKYLITLDLNGGSLDGEITYEVTYGENYSLPIPTSTDGPFNGWYLDNKKVTDKFGKNLKVYEGIEDVTLKAIYYIELSSVSDLINVNNDMEANYRLINDIDISATQWIPIGNLETPFTGIFDGQNFTINGLTITQPHDYVGLFGYSSGVIKDIILDSVNINFNGNLNQEIYGASLVGYNRGIVENVTTLSGLVSFKIRSGVDGYIGGIIGYNKRNVSILSSLHNNLNVIGDLTTRTGGIIGYVDSNFNVTITNSYNSGEVNGSSFVGGLLGFSKSLTITNSYNSGQVNGNSSVGGLVGGSYSLTYNNSYNSGKINSGGSAGGLVGYSDSSIFTNSYNIGEVNGGYSVGGLVGESNSSSTFTNSYNSGQVNGSGTAGGLVGRSYILSLNNSYNSGKINSGSTAGGLVGYSRSSTLTNSYNSGEVNGVHSVGGLVGESAILTITNSYNSGKVNGSQSSLHGGSYVGGLVGASYENLTITNSYNCGDINGESVSSYIRSSVGGLIGTGIKVYIYYSINFGKVRSTQITGDIGGVLGYISEAYDEELVFHTGEIYDIDIKVKGLNYGIMIEDLSIFTEEFFVETMGWEEESIVLISVLECIDSILS